MRDSFNSIQNAFDPIITFDKMAPNAENILAGLPAWPQLQIPALHRPVKSRAQVIHLGFGFIQEEKLAVTPVARLYLFNPCKEVFEVLVSNLLFFAIVSQPFPGVFVNGLQHHEAWLPPGPSSW